MQKDAEQPPTQSSHPSQQESSSATGRATDDAGSSAFAVNLSLQPPDSVSGSAAAPGHHEGTVTSSPVSSSSFLMMPMVPTARKPLIGDSSCLSFEYECSCPPPEKTGTAPLPERLEPESKDRAACKLMAFIVAAILFSAVIALLRRGGHTNYPFALTSKFGRVSGYRVFVKGGQPVIRYLSIPYAVPPLRQHRFSPSNTSEPLRHLDNGSEPRIINSNERIRHCPQDGSPLLPQWFYASPAEAAESCLYLNVWTPDTECLFSGPDCGNRTVIVFFHGGDLRHGSNKAYDGALLSSKADAVVAIPNYRLGLLGHSPWNESVSVSLGLDDQLTAIRWLQENVGFFGGNASRLVLMGHGAGAASVGHWMLSTQPELANARRFVMISGSPYARYVKHPDVVIRDMRILARRIQCEGYDDDASVENVLPCIREAPSETVLPRLNGLNGDPLEPSRSMDDDSGGDIPTAVKGKSLPRALLFGTVTDEGFHVVNRLTAVREDPQEWVQRWLQGQGINNISAFLEDYERELVSSNLTAVWSKAYGDTKYYCPVRRFAERMVRSEVNVYRFVLDARPSFEEPALHGNADHYAIVRLLLTDLSTLKPSKTDLALRDLLVSMVGSFAHSGQLPEIQGGDAWPPFGVLHKMAVRVSQNGLQTTPMDRDPCVHIRAHDATGNDVKSTLADLTV